jgi:hypothetical protein
VSDRPSPTPAVRTAAVAAWLEGGWIFLDGAHRLVTGDYIRLRGSLGPWAEIVAEAGIDPMSLGALFLVLGLGIVIGGVGLLAGRRWAWSWAVLFAVCTLWLLPVGTLFSLAILALLLLPSTRAAFRHAA